MRFRERIGLWFLGLPAHKWQEYKNRREGAIHGVATKRSKKRAYTRKKHEVATPATESLLTRKGGEKGRGYGVEQQWVTVDKQGRLRFSAACRREYKMYPQSVKLSYDKASNMVWVYLLDVPKKNKHSRTPAIVMHTTIAGGYPSISAIALFKKNKLRTPKTETYAVEYDKVHRRIGVKLNQPLVAR